MDLNTLDTSAVADEGAAMEVRGPNGEPLKKDDGSPITITLLGSDSEVARKARYQATNRYLKNRGRSVITAEASDADAIAILVKCTKTWDGIVLEGEELACTLENVRKVYERFAFIREQADEFIADRANFLKASPKN